MVDRVKKTYTRGDISLREFLACLDVVSRNECWSWKYSLDSKGYGNVRRNGKLLRAHRVSYQLHHGITLKRTDLVLHKCDNRRCCNPLHLYVGTDKDNTRDKVQRDRHNRGERVWNHILTADDVLVIRALSRTGLSNVEIAKQYGVSRDAIYAVVTRINWKHV